MRREDETVTDSRSTLDDEVDDDPVPDSRETCFFWEPAAGRCHFELLVLGSEPCADCPDEAGEPAKAGRITP